LDFTPKQKQLSKQGIGLEQEQQDSELKGIIKQMSKMNTRLEMIEQGQQSRGRGTFRSREDQPKYRLQNSNELSVETVDPVSIKAFVLISCRVTFVSVGVPKSPGGILCLEFKKHGERFLQTSKLTIPWYSSFRCILLRDKELNRNNNKLAIVKYSGKKSVIIPPNSNSR
jgi:hypothetical protein